MAVLSIAFKDLGARAREDIVPAMQATPLPLFQWPSAPLAFKDNEVIFQEQTASGERALTSRGHYGPSSNGAVASVSMSDVSATASPAARGRCPPLLCLTGLQAKPLCSCPTGVRGTRWSPCGRKLQIFDNPETDPPPPPKKNRRTAKQDAAEFAFVARLGFSGKGLQLTGSQVIVCWICGTRRPVVPHCFGCRAAGPDELARPGMSLEHAEAVNGGVAAARSASGAQAGRCEGHGFHCVSATGEIRNTARRTPADERGQRDVAAASRAPAGAGDFHVVGPQV
ncbi:MAG: hypothetical protein BJ554DRAFT_3877 [Olpidium bornovanus]|uniref:Uncharacterized protein n=1 Tax=Olpidium bornovanus TaxID=278681 RepID=A0A8H8A0J3_9FUNG|nr:MAG: hypothetical protein BJ554DRAFT_3877 [Olpidium bornovanus]